MPEETPQLPDKSQETQIPSSLSEKERQFQHTSDDILSKDTPVWRNWKILVAILVILAMTGTLFAAYKIGQASRSRKPAFKISCQEDLDCILAINRKEQCCPCPVAVSKSELVQNKGLMIYLPGEMGWSQVELQECKDVDCLPCPPLNKAICESGRCRGVSQEVEPNLPTADWETYRFEKIYQMGDLRFEIQHPKEWQVLGEEEGVKWYAANPEKYLFFVSWLNPDFIYGVEGVCRSGMCDKISEIKAKEGLNIEIWKPTPERREHLSLAGDYLHATILIPEKPIVPEFGTPSLGLELFKVILSTFRFINEKSFGEKVFCKDLRPEVCTMECIGNPPYICGLDRKTYCSICQACSNPEVEWYVIQDAPCGLGDAVTKEECEIKGGVWDKWGLLGTEYCQIPSLDGGESCLDGSECNLGKCISVSGKLPGGCQKFKNTFGCFSFVEDGEAGRVICID